MVKLFKRKNGILYLEYKVSGRAVQKSTRLEDTPKNRTFIKNEVIPALQRKIIMGEVADNKPKDFIYYAKIFLKDKAHLKTYSQTESIVKVLNERFSKKRIDTINKGMVKAFVRDRLEVNTPKTVLNYLTPLRGIFDIAIDDEVMKDNPCDKIEMPPHEAKSVEPFSSEQVELLLTQTSGWMQTFLAIGFYTGLRTGEILGLMHSDIDMDSMVIRVKRSINKGRTTTPKTASSIRDVPIFDGLIKYLPKTKKSLWVFHKQDGKPYASLSGSKQAQWKKLLESCEIPYRKIYATRHTFIVSMLKNSDLSILEVAQLAGHTTTQMIIQNYAKFIKGEHLKIDRKICLFTDKSADTYSQSTI